MIVKSGMRYYVLYIVRMKELNMYISAELKATGGDGRCWRGLDEGGEDLCTDVCDYILSFK